MGFSLKKVAKTVTNVVKNPGNAIKKTVAVAQGAAAGFATGGVFGAAAGAGVSALNVSKTGKAPAITLKTALNQMGKGAVAGTAVAVTGLAFNAAGGASGIKAGLSGIAKSGGLVPKAISGIKTIATSGALGPIAQGFSFLSGSKAKAAVTDLTDAAGDYLNPQPADPGAGTNPGGMEQAAQMDAANWDRANQNEILPGEGAPATATPSGGSGWIGPVALGAAALFLMG